MMLFGAWYVCITSSGVESSGEEGPSWSVLGLGLFASLSSFLLLSLFSLSKHLQIRLRRMLAPDSMKKMP